jgi:hypothetical protein
MINYAVNFCNTWKSVKNSTIYNIYFVTDSYNIIHYTQENA